MGYENTFGRKPRHNPQKRDKYITVAFHIAPKQHEELYNRIRLSGRRVQDYLTVAGRVSRKYYLERIYEGKDSRNV